MSDTTRKWSVRQVVTRLMEIERDEREIARLHQAIREKRV